MDLGLIWSTLSWAFLLSTAQSNAHSLNAVEMSRHQKGHSAKEQLLKSPSALTW